MILVFGGQGQLGQELTAQASSKGLPLVALDRLAADIADPAAVIAAIDRVSPSFIVNAAAYNQVDRAEEEVDVARRTNAIGPGVIAAAAETRELPLVHISTDYVFDGAKSGAWREDDPVRPLSAYGRTKAEGENNVRAASMRHLILRTAWLFGAYGANFLKTAVRLAADRDVIEAVVDNRGSPTSTADLARAILVAKAAADRGPLAWGTYHVAGQGTASRYEQMVAIVAAQAQFTGRTPEVVPVASDRFPSAAARPRNSELDSSKFAASFGFRPAPWRIAIEQTVRDIFAVKAVA
jgi:dTDP-4-dehydrorhamnose reductase